MYCIYVALILLRALLQMKLVSEYHEYEYYFSQWFLLKGIRLYCARVRLHVYKLMKSSTTHVYSGQPRI